MPFSPPEIDFQKHLVAYLVDHDAFDTEGIESGETPVLDCRKALKGPRVEYL
jgi:hypothetical protein